MSIIAFVSIQEYKIRNSIHPQQPLQSLQDANEQLDYILQSVPDLGSWQMRARKLKNGLLTQLKINKYKNTDLLPLYGKRRIYKNYSVTNIVIQSLEGVYVTGSLYMPLNVSKKMPGILSPHGHWGRYTNDLQIRCATLAKMGCVVFAYDMVGAGEQKKMGWVHKHPNTISLQTWNSIRALDFLHSLDYVDTSKIAITGASGGATQAILLTVIDSRIKLSVPVVQVSATHFGGCICENSLNIYSNSYYETNLVELASLAAPRPMLIISNGKDWTQHTPVLEYPFIKSIYSINNAVRNLELTHLEHEGHDYGSSKRQAMYCFIAEKFSLTIKSLQNHIGNIVEDDAYIEPPEMLYIITNSNYSLAKLSIRFKMTYSAYKFRYLD